jgi:SAM-dependent methyltransferase
MDIFNYNEKKLETIPCNICGGTNVQVIVRRSVNDLKVNTVMCKTCSLVFISPRMSSKDYDHYYMSYYRLDRSSIKGKVVEDNNLEKNFQSARKFGHGIMDYMGQFVRDGLTVDVGSSTGGILYGMKEKRASLELLGIEPSVDESNYANSKGVKTIRGLFEDVELDLKGKVANILCVQSLNHLLDPKKFLLWSHDALQKDGHVFLAVKNWRHQVRRMGKLSSGVQIDHVYMFTPETLKLLCEVSGFKVVYMDVDEGKTQQEIRAQKEKGINTHHIRIVAQKINRSAKMAIPKGLYTKARIQLWGPGVKLWYLVRYSSKLAFVRKLLHI